MGLAFPFLNESSSLYNTSTQNRDLFQHLQLKHADNQQSQEVICPICASMANGEPNLLTGDLISHIANDHQQSQVNTPSSASGGTSSYLRQSLSNRDYDFGIGPGIRGGFRRGSSRTPSRRGGLGRGGGSVSQHFVVDPSSGLSTMGSGNDPIADLLTQLSTVRRLTIANNTNSSSSMSANTINLQGLTRQQFERERLRAAARSHHHHHHQSNHSQQSASISNIVPSAETDLFDSLFSSNLLIDPFTSSTTSDQTWTHIVAPQQQQQPIPEQQSQTSSSTKTPITTSTETDPSLLRRICDESSSSSLAQQNTTVGQLSKPKSDFVQSLLLSSFAYSVNDK
jgi:hypothetical protein